VRAIPGALLKGVDAVVYLAAISNDIMGQIDEKLTLDINCHAAVRLAREAKRRGAGAFVFASSCSVYGFAAEGAKTESSALDPLTAYARSKVMAEKALKPLASKGFRVTCFRFATACGMSDRLRLDLVLNDFVACAVASKKISILSDGSPWRPLIHIRDMARAIDWGISRKARDGGNFLVVNAGSDAWNVQVKDLAQAVARQIPAEVSINPNASPDRRSYRVDFGLFRKLAPDHQPQVTLEAAVKDLKEGLEGMGFRDADFRQSNWIRLKVLSRLREDGLLDEKLRWKREAGSNGR
jgi:nucleoside-diphosphate-sugar epimerase